jgi:hypothetical protein
VNGLKLYDIFFPASAYSLATRRSEVMQAINHPKHPGFQGYSLDEQEMTLHV